MIRTITMLAAESEGSPLGDMIRQNETLSGFLCIGAVVVGAIVLTRVFKR
jgi:hypothetical protein